MIVTIFEDDDIIVVDKPIGLSSQQTSNNEISLLNSFDKEVFSVHRLDQRVSGLILLAKNKKTQIILSEDFQNKKIQKKYRAIVANQPPKNNDKLTHWLVKNATASKSKAFIKELAHSKKAELEYTLIQSSLKYYLLEIDLLTGRFHQIRAQLAAIGCPIVGDTKYGYKRTTPDGSIFLQSFSLQLMHPTKNTPLCFEIDMPELWKRYGF